MRGSLHGHLAGNLLEILACCFQGRAVQECIKYALHERGEAHPLFQRCEGTNALVPTTTNAPAQGQQAATFEKQARDHSWMLSTPINKAAVSQRCLLSARLQLAAGLCMTRPEQHQPDLAGAVLASSSGAPICQ